MRKPASGKVVVTFVIERTQRDALQAKARNEGRSLSAQVRRYIEQALTSSAR